MSVHFYDDVLRPRHTPVDVTFAVVRLADVEVGGAAVDGQSIEAVITSQRISAGSCNSKDKCKQGSIS